MLEELICVSRQDYNSLLENRRQINSRNENTLPIESDSTGSPLSTSSKAAVENSVTPAIVEGPSPPVAVSEGASPTANSTEKTQNTSQTVTDNQQIAKTKKYDFSQDIPSKLLPRAQKLWNFLRDQDHIFTFCPTSGEISIKGVRQSNAKLGSLLRALLIPSVKVPEPKRLFLKSLRDADIPQSYIFNPKLKPLLRRPKPTVVNRAPSVKRPDQHITKNQKLDKKLSGSNMDKNLQKELEKLYYDPRSPGSYGGVRRLYLAARDKGIKVTQAACKNFLETQAPYQLFRRRRIKYPRNRYVTPGCNFAVSVDIWSLETFRESNRDFGYVLLGVDNLSRKAAGVTMQRKNTEDIIIALETIIKVLPMKILISDQERAIMGRKIQHFLTKNSIFHMYSFGSLKALMVERLIGTLSVRLARAMKAAGTKEWLSNGLLAKIIRSYNNSYHSALIGGKYRPIDITELNAYKIYDYQAKGRQMRPKVKWNSPLYGKGDHVMISAIKDRFDKQLYAPKFKDEIYAIHRVVRKGPRIMYELKSTVTNDILQGKFLNEELARVGSKLSKGPGAKKILHY